MSQLPEPQSPTGSRTLKGESIRSIRKLLRRSLSTSALADEVRLRNKIGSLKHDESPQEEEQRKQPGEDSADQKVDADDNDNNVDAEKAKETSDKVQARHAAAAHEIRLRMLQNLGIQKQQAAPLPKGKIRQSIFSPRKVAERSHAETRPATGKQ